MTSKISDRKDRKPSPPKKSIIIMDLPDELINRDTLTKYFEQFGPIERISCSLRHKYGIVHYNTAEAAMKAKEQGAKVDPQFGSAKIFFSNKSPAGTVPVARKSLKLTSPTKLYRARKSSVTEGDVPKRLNIFERAKRSSSADGPSGRNETKGAIPLESTSRPSAASNVFSSSFESKTANPAEKVPAAFEKVLRSSSVKKDAHFLSGTTEVFARVLKKAQGPQIRSASPPKPIKLVDKEQKPIVENVTYDLLTFLPDTAEAQELFSKKFTTAEERYRALETRDKLLRARIPKIKVRVELATNLFGTCSDMCPEKERYMRQYQRQLTIFEIRDSPDTLVDDRKAVKAYSRSSADQEEPLPHDLRPGSTLEMTMDYLLHNIVPIAENEADIIADWYNFLWDRTRSIRKDITQQQLTDLQAVSLMEKCARFHIHCSARLCELDLHSFEPKLNDENLMKCLQSLEHLYDDLRRRHIKCPNEPEFRAYQIMMNLNEGDILWDVQQRPEWILKSPEVCLALKIHHIVFNKNFVAFFRVIKNSPYMVSCILHRYFFQVRCAALRSLWKSHSCPPKLEVQVSFSAVHRMLGYGDSLAGFHSLCQSHGIVCDKINDRIVMNRRSFNRPESRIVSREFNLIESKLHTTVAEAINGGPLGPNPTATHRPHTSFDEEGYLIPGSVAGNGNSVVKPDRLTVPGQPSTLPSTPLNYVFDKSSSFAGAGNQKSMLQGFYKSSFQSKGGFGRSVSPKPVSQQGVSQNSQNLALSLSNGRFSPTTVKAIAAPTPEEIKLRKQAVLDVAVREACETLFDKLIQKEVLALAQIAFQEAKEEQRKRLEAEQKERIRSYWIKEAAERLEAIAVRKIVTQLANEEFQKLKLIRQMCEAKTEAIVHATIDFMLPSIVLEVVTEKKLEEKKLVEKAAAIFQRIKMRRMLHRWIENVKTKKLQKKLREEKELRDRLDFPAANAIYKSKEEVLIALRGKFKVGMRSPNLIKTGKTTTNWLDAYEKMKNLKESYQANLQNLAMKMGLVETVQDLSTINSAVVTPILNRRGLNLDYCHQLWKRKWSDGLVTSKLGESSFREAKSPRLELENLTNTETSSPKQKPVEDSLLEEIRLFMEETRAEKNKALIVPTLDNGSDINGDLHLSHDQNNPETVPF